VIETLRKPNQARVTVVGAGTHGQPRRRVRRIVVVALAILIACAAAAVGYSLLQPRVYGAQADFLVTPRPDISDVAAGRAMVTQVMIVTSDPVLQPVAARFGMSVSRLRTKVTAEMVGQSNILRITVGDRNRSRAVELARLVSSEYLDASTSVLDLPNGPDAQPPTRSTVLSPASALSSPLQPRPFRALAAGVLLGLLAAAIAVLVMMRPRWLTRPAATRG
jgi:capsular polysaccharide biosynthesis protein